MLLNPTSIAIIGASADEGSVGHDILKNLLTQGYSGKVFPVNPKREEILGAKCYKSVKDIQDAVDLVVIVVPAKIVPAVLNECAEKKVASAIVISAGFSEVHTDEGKKLEEEVQRIAAENNIALIGPNCLGIVRPSTKMNASFAKDVPPRGNIALVSQSGAMAVAIMDASNSLGIGYSAVFSIGNKAVMDESDLLELCEKDPETKVIGLYLENVKDGRRFKKIATRVSGKKAIVLLKAGVSAHGSKAASSHTGALAGSDAGVEALCRQTGIRRASTMEDFLNMLQVLGCEPPLLTSRIAIVTNAGGPGILATDAAEALRLEMPALSESTAKVLKEALPAAASIGNPIDVIGDAGVDRYKAALTACGDDPNVDGVCVLLTPQVMTKCDEIADAIIQWERAYPLMPVVAAFLGDDSVRSARAKLNAHKIPNFETPERAIQALAALRPTKPVITANGFETSDMRSARGREIIADSHAKGSLLPEEALRDLFELYGIPLPAQEIATTKKEATEIAQRIGYPVIAKINAPNILHKTDIGGIRADLQKKEDVEDAFDSIMANAKKFAPNEKLNGVLIQQFFPAGNEFIVGAMRDPSFGPLVMVGLGGIYTELLSDTSFRIAPITQDEGYRMLEELVAWKVLLGMRGQSKLDIDSLAILLEKLSQMVLECPEIKELDINPVIVRPEDIVVADAKVVLDS